ncbi:hypothetical protein SISNIDRAFT_460546 [Sistotremastrum niveocremeum HHB9708]|uniref:CFEM domain-containing protein n=1 Tax=Sistotremastrum niveocremeum HHB9708 TaxID=1314777 RepID=A0A164NK36_9AGAM|nr:hypothetical protein SISNIDRAFT_460546 [Sistotremastrum niveocremeum HHB9708]
MRYAYIRSWLFLSLSFVYGQADLALNSSSTSLFLPTTTIITTSVNNHTTTITSLITAAPSQSTNTTASTTTTATLPSLSNTPVCTVQCFEQSVSAAGCDSEAAVSCYCTRVNFTSALAECVFNSCPSDQLQSSEQLASQFCNVQNVTLSFPTPTSSSTSTSSTSSSSTPTGSGTTTSSSASSSPSANDADRNIQPGRLSALLLIPCLLLL